MAKYDFKCLTIGCKGNISNHEWEEGQDSLRPKCPICDELLATWSEYYQAGSIGFKGFTTPGGNGRPVNLSNKMPSELKNWYKHRMDVDRFTASEAAKPITFPDGTVHKGVKESSVSQDNLI